MRAAWVFIALAALLPGPAGASERWRMQYNYDEDSSSLTLDDLKFSSPQRGVGVGYITEAGKTRPVALVTRDGGEHWNLVQVPEAGRALFFVNETLGWMVTRSGVWRTDEAGQNWKRCARLSGLVRVCFQDDKHGWAIGMPKAIYETWDGGNKWSLVPAAAQPKTTREYTVYNSITFANQRVGLVTGSSRPPRRQEERRRLPAWMEPDRSENRREWPAVTIMLETRDGGKNWSLSETTLFGAITEVRLAPNGQGLGLVQFFESFTWPSEVFQFDWRTGKSSRVFRQKDRCITDLALLPDGPAYLAGIEPQGTLTESPVPGRVKVLRSSNFTDWQEIEVDYRASARRVVLAAAAPGHIWVATDTGMVLKLVAE
jgi:photosystem II stability/assembly factor-like uncharacterized protein